MEGWRDRGMEGWRTKDGGIGMEEWRDGRMERQRDGGMANRGMERWRDGET